MMMMMMGNGCIGMSKFPVWLVAVVGDPGSDYSVYGNSGHPGGI